MSSSRSSHKRHYESDEEHERKSSRHSKSSVKPIHEDDYFEKSTEFRLWLKESKHKYMDELSSKESRRYFKKFVRKWNDHDLDDKYYKGMNSSRLESSDTTRYKWSFAKNVDKNELDSVRDKVDSMTALSSGDDKLKYQGKRRAQAVGPSLPDTFEKEERYEAERQRRKYEDKKRKDRRESMLDEVAPRETGREAQLAKKRALNAYHKRERSPDVELSEADLMGGDDFQARLAAEKRREARQAEKREERMAPIRQKMDDYRAKESATMDMFRKMAEEQKKRGAY